MPMTRSVKNAAVLMLAGGNADELPNQVKLAHCDIRDVLVSAEYPAYFDAGHDAYQYLNAKQIKQT